MQTATDISADESLNKAVVHVNTGWLPVQSPVLEKVRDGLKLGIYASRRELLLHDIKQDLSLYMFCLRELGSNLSRQKGAEEAEAATRGLSPREIFEISDLGRLETMLAQAERPISAHDVNSMTPLQAQRFRESMLSASTAEILAAKKEIEPETAFSCGLIRQLGLTLIAWNYPRVYSKAISSIGENDTLDSQLEKVLGFSPNSLGQRLAQQWNLSAEILEASSLSQEAKGDLRTTSGSDPAGMLAKICEVGEALARANEPDIYPTAEKDWQWAQSNIAEQLGPQGVENILEKAKEHSRSYLSTMPAMKDFAAESNIKDLIASSQYAASKLAKNSYLKTCPPRIRERLAAVYSGLRPGKISRDNLRQLLFHVLPASGFNSGCIYMLDPQTRALMPQTKIGELPAERAKPVKLSSSLSHLDLVSSAFSLKTPLKEDGYSKDEQASILIASSLGSASSVGVLYLEILKEEVGEQDPINTFRAIRQTLCDCLNL